MIKPNLIWGLILGAIVLVFLLMITFGYLFSKKEDKSISFFSHFPFEIIKGEVSNIFLIIYMIVAFAPLFVIIPLFGEFGDFAVFNIFIAAFFGLFSLVVGAIIKITTKYIVPHIRLASILMAGAFLMSALTSLHFFLNFSMMSKFPGNGYVHLSLGIIAGLLALGMLVVMFNPRLKKWAQLEEHIDGDNKIFDRPKFFPLAYSEWISVIVLFISQLLFMLSLINF